MGCVVTDNCCRSGAVIVAVMGVMTMGVMAMVAVAIMTVMVMGVTIGLL
jgi:hypothetical protein